MSGAVFAHLVLLTGLSFTLAHVESDLRKTLFADYDRQAIPVLNSSQPLLVTVKTFLIQVVQLEILHQRITLSVWMGIKWKDAHLRWNMTKFPLRYIHPALNEIWRPDITVYNAIGKSESLITDERATVYNDGTVFVAYSDIIVVPCDVDVREFPYDTQTCSIIIGSWAFNSEYITLNRTSVQLISQLFHNNSEWQLLRTEGRWFVEEYDAEDQQFFDLINYKLVITRKPVYYLWNLVVPCMGLLLIGIVANFLPPDGERLTLTSTTLLAFTVFLQMVPSILPPQSDSIPAIAQLFGFSVILLTFSTATTIIVIGVKRRGEKHVGAGPWVRCLLLKPIVTLGLRARSRLVQKLVRMWSISARKSTHGHEDLGETPSSVSEEKFEIWRVEWAVIAMGLDLVCLMAFLIGCVFNISNFMF